jgi:hypothetical protein
MLMMINGEIIEKRRNVPFKKKGVRAVSSNT